MFVGATNMTVEFCAELRNTTNRYIVSVTNEGICQKLCLITFQLGVYLTDIPRFKVIKAARWKDPITEDGNLKSEKNGLDRKYPKNRRAYGYLNVKLILEFKNICSFPKGVCS